MEHSPELDIGVVFLLWQANMDGVGTFEMADKLAEGKIF